MKEIFQNKIVKNIAVMLVFGILSLILGEIKFYVPGFEGTATDLREVAVFLSVLYLPHWIYLVGISLITSITTPTDGSIISTFITHIVGSFAAFYFYRHVILKIGNNIYKGFVWAAMIVANYFILLLPTLVITSVLFGLIDFFQIIESYLAIISIVKYEIFTTTAVTSLFVVSFQMRQDLIKNNLQLLRAKERAEESDKLKTAFLENISHEIRTPLNSIVGFSNILVEQDVTEENARKFKDIINESTEYLLKLIGQIIDFAKIESKFSDFQFSWKSLDEIITEIDRNVKEIDELVKNNIFFKIEIDEEVRQFEMRTEQFFLYQIIINLVHNAIKFSKNNIVVLRLKKLNEEQILVEIEDKGIGIEEKYHEKIFDRFFQIDSFQSGVGLSLTLTKKMIELLKGEITVESEPGKGSLFYFKIPVQFKVKEIVTSHLSTNIALFNKEKSEVLIAEDEDANYKYIKTLLDKSGINSCRASNGEEAVSILQNNGNIGLVLMDIKMPHMDGITAIKKIRSFKTDVPVIIQTAYDLNNEIDEAYKAGCTDFITKPINKNNLFSIINKYSSKYISSD